MALEFFKENYAGSVKQITLGAGDNAVAVGGETCYPFYQFEGEMPCKPKIAMEIWDMQPEEWAAAALKPFEDVIADPAAWAKKCVDEYGAEMIVLQLKSIDPNDKDASPEDAVATVKKVLDAIDVPLILWGSANVEKDEAVFKAIAEACQGANLIIGPVEDKNHKGIGAAAMGYGHTVISSSPIDVNLAKQVNILLENLGMPLDRVIIDPTTGGLGYGLEYSYSVMERLRMAALQQGDDKLQLPIINNLANEIWKCKEAKEGVDEAPTMGDPEKRGILMEAVGAVTYLLSGADVLIMRHPEAIRLTKAFIDLIQDGGSAVDVAPIAKQLPAVEVDLAALAPEPDLTIEEEKKQAAPAKKAAPKPEAAKPAAKPAPQPKAAEAPKAAPKAAPEAAAPAEEKVDAQAEAAAKAKAEAEAKAKAEAAAKAKAEAEARAQAEAAAKAKAEAEAKAKAEAAAKEAAVEADMEDIRAKLAKKKKAKKPKKAAPAKKAKKTKKKAPKEMDRAAEIEKQLQDMLTDISRWHRHYGR